MMKRHVYAFDLDDTLYSERDYVDACLRNVAAKFSERLGRPAERLYELMRTAPNAYDALAAAAPEAGVTLDEFKEVYRSTQPDALPLRHDARLLLEHLKADDVPVYLITDGRSLGQRAKIKALGLERYFSPDRIIISGETGYEKTTPVPFMLAMRRHGSPTAWTYVGDNPYKDFRWPNLLGWDTVMLADTEGTNTHTQQPGMYPPGNYAARTIADLCDSIS